MSLIPYLFDMDPWGYRSRHSGDLVCPLGYRSYGMSPDDIRSLMELPHRMASHLDGYTGELTPAKIGKDGFQASIDVKQFKPEEIAVKTVDNNIVVEGKHEERQDDHGYVSRHFVRRYALPKDYDPNQVSSTLSSDGVLTVKALPPNKPAVTNERIVQIEKAPPAKEAINDKK